MGEEVEGDNEIERDVEYDDVPVDDEEVGSVVASEDEVRVLRFGVAFGVLGPEVDVK